jgi:hypothetical protein
MTRGNDESGIAGAGRAGRSSKAKGAPAKAARSKANGSPKTNGARKAHASATDRAMGDKAIADKAIEPIPARPSRAERAVADERSRRIDEVCAAWAAIVAERMAADQQFADLYEVYGNRTADLRGLFAWDALHAAEAHLSLVNTCIARHLADDGRGDPRAILAELRWEQRKLAAVYAVNAFAAVLNQMSPNKAKWVSMQEFDPRIAVLSLAHQTLGYALEALRFEAPGDLTDHILKASQDQRVWAIEPERDHHRLNAAAYAAAAFFRAIGATELSTAEEIGSLYTTRAQSRRAQPPRHG